MLHGAGTFDKVFTSLLGFEVLTLHAARLLVWSFLPPEEFKFCTRFGNREPYSKLTFRGFRYFCTGGQWLQTHLPKKPSDVEPAISRIPTLPVCLWADRDGPSVGRQLRRGPQQAVRRNHEFHRPGLRALQRWSSRTSGGTPRAGHADPGDEPHGGSGSLAADRAFGF